MRREVSVGAIGLSIEIHHHRIEYVSHYNNLIGIVLRHYLLFKRFRIELYCYVKLFLDL
jgi:hypothetical protein